jgi:cell division protein FtsB
MKNSVVTPNEFEEQLSQLQEKFSLLERRLSLKADEVVFSMTVSHRKEIDELRDEVFQLRDELKKMKKERRQDYLGKVAQQAKRRSVG